MLKKIVVLCLLFPLPALAIFMVYGKKVNYLDTEAKVQYSGQGTIAISTEDDRPYVVSGKKAPTFVGNLRGGYGNSFDVLNETTHPLADDISASIAASLTNAGFKATVDVPPKGETNAQAAKRMASLNADRLVVVQLREFKTDGYANYALYTDVTFSIYDRAGNLLQSVDSNTTRKTEKPDGGSYKAFAARLTEAYHAQLEAWLNDSQVRSALITTESTPAASP